jgi:hypothetical protein
MALCYLILAELSKESRNTNIEKGSMTVVSPHGTSITLYSLYWSHSHCTPDPEIFVDAPFLFIAAEPDYGYLMTRDAGAIGGNMVRRKDHDGRAAVGRTVINTKKTRLAFMLSRGSLCVCGLSKHLC